MTKKSKRTDGFESDEEMFMSWYFEELKEIGAVTEIVLQPKSFKLSSEILHTWIKPMKKVADKISEEIIMSSHLYTADVLVYWDPAFLGTIITSLDTTDKITTSPSNLTKFFVNKDKEGRFFSVVEIKPIFDQNNMTRAAKINQKWVWDKYGIYVQFAIPDKIFKNTFTPVKYDTHKRYKRDNSKKKIKKGDTMLKYKRVALKDYIDRFEINKEQTTIF